MNLANKLTLSRIALTFIFMWFLFLHWPYAKLCALFIFLLASITDYYDGKIAKKYGIITDFGKLMDPIADKILVLAAFLAFVELKILPAWMVMIVILRELVITGMRLTLLSKKKVVAASRAGKHKTVSQMASIFVILVYLAIKQLAGAAFKFSWWTETLDYNIQIAIYIMMFVTVVLTLTSGLSYLKENIKALR
ncbi:MAG: CDP-diacylglycerol--glycerol-3-phosphate 3-phosphatidyltransferase [Candidatus Omnitrophica bacterium]|nr:CDP-diacylglycerol--glycerol-3-phosphate 3-phosphatidyltransferase [Candidatus Omnitrophota bacterium]